ncbi:hypothetical protein EV421DRAFT_1741963 [Armillaria borealis]|uniref:Uncharacterized protein n=1 Tax=Armillaria borealis TaxID=47425 RepID=A0AA39IYH2_9AGAR|nr:hypothetical protein EV421DRAFT_1741963 [Armillaria borealis]
MEQSNGKWLETAESGSKDCWSQGLKFEWWKVYPPGMDRSFHVGWLFMAILKPSQKRKVLQKWLNSTRVICCTLDFISAAGRRVNSATLCYTEDMQGLESWLTGGRHPGSIVGIV